MKERIDISIIIVSYNTKDLLAACLGSLERARGNKKLWEIFVVDNGSVDESIAYLENYAKKQKFFGTFTLIKNTQNTGFAKANNQAIRRSRGRYVLLLNSDTEVSADSLSLEIEYMDAHTDVGASTCKLVLTNGSLDPACHRGFPTPWVAFTYLIGMERLFPKSRLFGEYHQGYKNFSTVHEIDCMSGAFFIVRREVIDTVGILDEEYFFYAEDIDWAYRIKQNGWKIVYNPQTSVLHRKKQSGRANVLRKRRVTTEIYFHTYNWLFFKKHYQKKYGPVVAFAINSIYGIRLFLLKHFSL